MSSRKLKPRILFFLVFAFCSMTAILFGIYTKSFLSGVYLFLFMLFVGIICQLLYIFPYYESIFDAVFDTFAFQIAKDKEAGLWITGLTFLLFIILTVLAFINVYSLLPAESFEKFNSFMWMWIFSLFFFLISILLLFSSMLYRQPRLSSEALSKEITPELIMKNPQAAINHAFSVFEATLRKKSGAKQSLHVTRLIKEAYVNDELGSTELEGVRNLMEGAYITFQNPGIHNFLEANEKNAKAFIDLLLQILEKKETAMK